MESKYGCDHSYVPKTLHQGLWLMDVLICMSITHLKKGYETIPLVVIAGWFCHASKALQITHGLTWSSVYVRRDLLRNCFYYMLVLANK